MIRPLIALSLVLLIGLPGCAGLPHMPHWVKVEPVHRGGEQLMATEDSYYAAAAGAIGRRDYAQALDLLQAARARNPQDVKVLNAFGVVYDKLGRFDLSARYYAQARALDSSSPILAANIAYSAALQQRAETPTPAEPAQTTVAGMDAAQSPPSAQVIRLGFASAPAPQVLPLLAGHTLAIANASGRADGAEPARVQLARLGWSAPKTGVREVAPQARTTIVYAERHAQQARALARTLPYGIQLIACADGCAGVSLSLGADSLGWPLSGARRASGD